MRGALLPGPTARYAGLGAPDPAALHVESFGVHGDGATDDTEAMQRALVAAVAQQRALRDRNPSSTYSVRTLVAPPGLPSFKLAGTLTGRGDPNVDTWDGIVQLGDYALASDGVSDSGTPLSDCEISVRIDLADTHYRGIYGQGPVRVRIHDSEITGLTTAFQRAGIWIASGGEDCTFENNAVHMAIDAAAGALNHYGFLLQGRPLSYGGYYIDGNTDHEPNAPITGFTLLGNRTVGGSVGIGGNSIIEALIRGNALHAPSHRGVSLQGSSHRNIVDDNDMTEYFSSAVTMGSGANDNQVTDNRATKTGSIFGAPYEGAGEAAINMAQGARRGVITGNDVDSYTGAGIYVGPDCQDTRVEDNDVAGYSHAGILVESAWVRPSTSRYRRQYFAPLTPAEVAAGFRYGYGPLTGIVVDGNRIGIGRRVSPSDRLAGIAITQDGQMTIPGVRVSANGFADASHYDDRIALHEAISNGLPNRQIQQLAA